MQPGPGEHLRCFCNVKETKMQIYNISHFLKKNYSHCVYLIFVLTLYCMSHTKTPYFDLSRFKVILYFVPLKKPLICVWSDFVVCVPVDFLSFIQLVNSSIEDMLKEVDTTQYHPPELLDQSAILMDNHIEHVCSTLCTYIIVQNLPIFSK